jgi:antitoxin component YwqK of YwqJK toxin-antitoxin module
VPEEEKLEVRTEKYPNGQLQTKGKVSVRDGEDIQVGVWTHWFEDGSKAAEVSYKDGNEEGPMRMWHPNGKEKMSATLKNGKPSGTANFWYENGNKERTEHYRDGAYHGSIESWYENGQIANRHNMVDGKAEGADQGWYPNGKEMFSKLFKDGLADGKATAWYESGSRRWEFTYLKGQLHGSYTRWYRDGQIWFEGSYAGGQPDGSWKAHHHNRAPLLEATYAAGKVVSQRCWSNKRKKRKCDDDETSELRGDYESDADQPKGNREQFGEIYLMHLSEQKDKLCACDDDACVQKVSGFMDKFAFEFQGIQPSPAAGTQLTSIGREITACRAALGSEYRGLYKQ